MMPVLVTMPKLGACFFDLKLAVSFSLHCLREFIRRGLYSSLAQIGAWIQSSYQRVVAEHQSALTLASLIIGHHFLMSSSCNLARD